MTDTDDCCGRCAYFVGGAVEGGTCHRYNPDVLPDGRSAWPAVGPEDWCGEFEEDVDDKEPAATTAWAQPEPAIVPAQGMDINALAPLVAAAVALALWALVVLAG